MSDEKTPAQAQPGPEDSEVTPPADDSAAEPKDAVTVEAPALEPAQAATTTEAMPPPPAAARKLVRRPEDKIIAGVCSGIAAYTGLDPVVVRVAVVVLTVFTGVGLIAYLVAWLVMPMAPEGEPIPAAPPRDDSNIGRWVGIGAILLGAVVLFHNIWDFRGGIFWGLLLVGVGVALWGREFAPRPDRPNDPAPSWPQPPTTTTSGTNPTAPLPPAPPAPPPTRPAASAAPAPSPARREPSLLGRAVVGAAALAVGIALLLDNTEILNVTPRGVVAVLLLIVGVGLFIGTWFGRARWLVFPGIVLAAVLGILAVLPNWEFGDGAGERSWRPQTLSQVRSEYRLGAGELLVDLSEVDFEGRSRSIEASVGFGELIVIVPKEVTVEVDARSGAGEVDLFGRNQGGLGVNNEARERGERGAGTLRIEANVGFGEVTIRRGDDVSDLRELRRDRIEIGVGRNRDFNGFPGLFVDMGNDTDRGSER